MQLVRQLEADAEACVQSEKLSRLAAWRQTCRTRWRDPRQRRFIYAWLRDTSLPIIALVTIPGSTQISMKPVDIEQVLWQKWQPIFCPSPEQEDVPDFASFWNRFGHYVVRAPVVLQKLTGERLRAAVLRMPNNSAGGADGWTVSELKSWPVLLFDKLADFLNDVEAAGGDWPEELLQIVSLIPKDETGDDQRPVTVATLVYRAWTSACFFRCVKKSQSCKN